MLGIRPANKPLAPKIYNAHYDRMVETGNLNPEIIEYLDKYQQRSINDLKKSLTRLKNKYELIRKTK